MKFKKFFASVLSVLYLCISLSVPTFAAETHGNENETIVPMYEIATEATSRLGISGNTAYCTSEANTDDIVSISVEQTLEKYSGLLWIWNEVDGATWSSSANRNSITAYNSKSGLSSGKYRLKSVFTLRNSSGETETITVYSDEKSILNRVFLYF